MTKQEKQRQWLLEQGYRICGDVIPVWMHKDSIGGNTTCEITFLVSDRSLPIIGIVKDKQFIPIPQFEDDKPEPVDKALQELINKVDYDPEWQKTFIELNNRLKAVESKVSGDE